VNPAWCIERTDRERLVISGPDRAKFLHNLCTNDIKALGAGQGCEAFVTNLQGKTLAYVSVHALDDRLLIRSDPHGLEAAIPHFRKYGVFDEVEIENTALSTCEFHVVGLLEPPGTRDGDHAPLAFAGAAALTIRESPFGTAGVTLIAPRDARDAVIEALEQSGAPSIDRDTVETLRIAAGTPVFGLDVTDANLPQEIDRDRQAISFTKGCYLGQETVARLDALGHVNKILRRIESIDGEPPAPGQAVSVNGVEAGTITSSAQSEKLHRKAALAVLRVKAAPVGSTVSWTGGQGIVANLAPG
jgi:folate-binding protein YgfZ